jgi:hypothetical protein
VLRGVGGDPASGVAYFDLASDGTLVYAAADPGERQFRLSWLAEDGTYTDLDLPEREYRLPRLSPDGRMLVVGIGRGSGSTSDLWLHRLGTAGLERFTFDEHSTTPLWSRDSRWIVFESNTGRQTFARKPIDGSSEPHELLAFDDHHSRGPLSYAPDGTLLYSDDFGAAFANELLILRPGESAGVKVVSSPAVEIAGQFSPDGRFLAYAQNVSGEAQIFVQAYPGPGGRWQVAQEATGPFRWSTDGRQIFYVSGRGLMAVAVDTREGFSIGAPRRLADVAFLHSADVFSNFDVAADGRFLVVRRAGGAPELGRIRVALNWFATIREALAGP